MGVAPLVRTAESVFVRVSLSMTKGVWCGVVLPSLVGSLSLSSGVILFSVFTCDDSCPRAFTLPEIVVFFSLFSPFFDPFIFFVSARVPYLFL